MTLKICFDNQTHKISKNPTDYSALLKKVVEIFGNQLPQNWTLQYLDSDEDKIMLNSQEDYKTLLEEEISESKKSVKVFVLPLEETSLIKNEMSFAVEEKRNEEVIEKPVTIIEDAESVYIVEPQELIKEQEIIPEEKVLIKEEEVAQDEVEIAEEPIQQEKKEVHQEKKEVHQEEGKLIVEKTKEELKQEKIQEKKRKIQEKEQKKAQQVVEKQAKKKKQFEDIIVDLLFEQLPTIASYNRDFILQENKPKTQKVERAPPVHRGVQCDGCGVFSLTGIRYKCLECADFDFCEKCEATKEHAHPFIKFKKPQGEFERRNSPFHNHFEVLRPQPQREQRELPHPFWFNHGGHRINTEQYRPRSYQYDGRRSHPGFLTFYV